jgi:signal transduction histidine kinase
VRLSRATRLRPPRSTRINGLFHDASSFAFSRQQALTPQALDANKLVEDICELLRRTLGEAIVLETMLGDRLWRTYADANQLENALVNLGLNERDAMPDGGKLIIETANATLDKAYVSSLSESIEPGEFVLIAITDTGAGMDKTTRERRSTRSLRLRRSAKAPV